MTAILFDFFGTLVDYSPSRTGQGYRRSHELLPELTYPQFLAAVDAAFEAHDAGDAEVSMAEVAAHLLGRPVDDPVVAEFDRRYIAEWSTGVRPLDGLVPWLRNLRRTHRLAVVSNTHSPAMVPGFLASLGVRDLFDAVVLSVDVGYRKPHPAMYAAALAALGVGPDEAVFVGDNPVADYAGPTAYGIRSFLVDAPAGVPDEARLTSVFDLDGRL